MIRVHGRKLRLEMKPFATPEKRIVAGKEKPAPGILRDALFF